MRVLIVDDDEDIRYALSFLVEILGHETLAAPTGMHAVSLARSWLPDLILMDMQMAVMDGIAATTAIRRISELDGTYIVAHSAHVRDRAWCERILSAGANECIAKPMASEVLRELTQRVAARER